MKVLCLLAACAFIAAAAHADDAVPQSRCLVAEDQAAIEHVIGQWMEAYNGGDPAKVAALYTPDATYLTQHYITGIVQGRAAIEAYVKLGVDAHYHIDSIKVLASQCAGTFAFAITRYDATNGGQKAFGVNLVVLTKSNSAWLIAAHEAAVPDISAAIKHLDVR